MKIGVERVTVRFGAVAALADVSLDVASGERRAVIGPNGAGKTTLFNVISGDLGPTAGTVHLDGRDVTRLAPWRRSRRGLARTYQRSTLFPGLSVAENLALAVRARLRSTWRFWPGAGERRVRAEVEERLERSGLAAAARRAAADLSHGEQRALEIELALASGPRALLLDEPMAGLSGGERQSALERLRTLPAEVTIVIVEHDLDAIFTIAERITVLDHGILLAEGSPEEVRADPRVQEVYLGV
jgi:branched-chain amino acid transport system ATP-binding protein